MKTGFPPSWQAVVFSTCFFFASIIWTFLVPSSNYFFLLLKETYFKFLGSYWEIFYWPAYLNCKTSTLSEFIKNPRKPNLRIPSSSAFSAYNFTMAESLGRAGALGGAIRGRELSGDGGRGDVWLLCGAANTSHWLSLSRSCSTLTLNHSSDSIETCNLRAELSAKFSPPYQCRGLPFQVINSSVFSFFIRSLSIWNPCRKLQAKKVIPRILNFLNCFNFYSYVWKAISYFISSLSAHCVLFTIVFSRKFYECSWMKTKQF